MVVKTSMRAPSWLENFCACAVTVLHYIHYINLDLLCNFIIDGYGIFPYFCCTILYTKTMSAYTVFFSISYPSVLTLDSILFLFDPLLITFQTHFLVEGSIICKISKILNHMTTLNYIVNIAPCKYFIKKSVSMWYVLQYAIDTFFLLTWYLSNK